MKEMATVTTTMMTEEEKAEMEKELNAGMKPATPPTAVTPDVNGSTPAEATTSTAEPTSSPIAPQPSHPVGGLDATAMVHTPSPSETPAAAPTSPAATSTSPAPESHSPSPAHKEKKKKLSPEQRKKLEELEEERRKRMQERIETLTKKLVERLRPFVEAAKPGDKDDAETKAFEARIKKEAEDLKLESFGIEVCGFVILETSVLTI